MSSLVGTGLFKLDVWQILSDEYGATMAASLAACQTLNAQLIPNYSKPVSNGVKTLMTGSVPPGK